MNTRRIVDIKDSWQDTRAAFRWLMPKYYNIAERCCDSWAVDDPDKVAIIDANDGDRVWTFGQLKDASDRLARVLADRGVGKGDCVGVLLSQSPAVMITHFAAYKIGAVILPLFTPFGPDALLYRLSDSAARLVVTDSEGAAKLEGLRADLPSLTTVLSLDGGKGEAFWNLIAATAPIDAALRTLAEDPAVLIYTSGTTGAPKGVLHAHRFLIGHLPCAELALGDFPQPGDCGWTPADWAWIGGLMDLAMPCLYFGVPLVSCRMRKFDAAQAWDLIARLNVRNLFLPPTALKLMRAQPVPKGADVRSVISGGESLGADLLDWGRTALGVEIAEIYGQTECNLSTGSVPGRMQTRPGSIGLGFPGFDVQVQDDTGAETAPGVTGEICVRKGTPVMMLRYLNKPQETAKKYRGDWLRTGDLGQRDEMGRITFVSRDDDVITSAGYRIGPTEIENCLLGHPDVVMAAVVGEPDPDRTEIVVAHVVVREGADTEALKEALRKLVADKVSPHMAPRRVEFAESLPMTATGKIMRRALRTTN